MLRLEKINSKNVWEIIKLKVSKDQQDYVAPNDLSIIEAYTTIMANGHVYTFGVYDEDTPVGFVMIGYDVDDDWTDGPEISKGNYNLWRLMIDEKQQKKGYGRQVIQLALDFIRTYPCGPAEYCYLSYEPENEVAKKLYHSFGFVENGQMDDDEVVAVLKL